MGGRWIQEEVGEGLRSGSCELGVYGGGWGRDTGAVEGGGDGLHFWGPELGARTGGLRRVVGEGRARGGRELRSWELGGAGSCCR